MNQTADGIQAIEWTEAGLRLLDQRRLPAEEQYLLLESSGQVAEAIRDMVVRGAPAIGITAAYGVVLAARDVYARDPQGWKSELETALSGLATARPTAVNLGWALERMRRRLAAESRDPLPALLDEARRIHAEDIAANRRMGELGATLIEPGQSVLTHCNAGALATGGYGTALGVIRSAWQAGKLARVFADETRPWLQGARLTAWELLRDAIPVTLIVEGAAAHLMRSGEVDWVIVGADRIAANGDVANKIGTFALALAARQLDVGFMVVAPGSTIDMRIPDGTGIPIELRGEDEVLSFAGKPVAAGGAEAWNPAFDITPAHLIDAIVSENGVVRNPDANKMAALMACRPFPASPVPA
jgi:methylthioribose-1-phosphate isomerase